MSEGPAWKIQYGIWHNYEYPKPFGLTLTATNHYGFLLNSCITIFISYIGGQIWTILCFCLHQIRATPELTDGLHHQIQAELRNSQSAMATMYEFIKIARAWDRHAKRPWRRLLPWIILAGLEAACFTLLGIFANNVVGFSTHVLLRPKNCGYVNAPVTDTNYNQSDWQALDAWAHEFRLGLFGSLGYARSCYGTDTVKAGACGLYQVPQLQPTFVFVDCPFGDNICLDGSGQGAYKFDSGIINSNYHLGVNAGPDYSVNYQRQMTCAPLSTDGYVNIVNDTTEANNYFYNYYYGQAVGDYPSDYTYGYANISATYLRSPYDLYVVNSFSGSWSNSSSFRPISALNVSDSDVTLIFLVNNAKYTAPVQDPWYSATQEQPDTDYIFGGTLYTAQEPISVMGCVEQHRWCDPSYGNGSEHCSAWGPIADLYTFGLWHDTQLPAVDELLEAAISNTGVSSIVQQLGAYSLNTWLSVNQGDTLLTLPLARNQWTLDVQSWMNTSLAYIQRSVVSVAAGPSSQQALGYVTPPSANFTAIFDVCKAQRVQDQKFYSFSVTALVVLFAFGFFIIIVNAFLPKVTAWVRLKWDLDYEKKEDWDKDHLLQIQRMAYQANRLGKWRSSKGPGAEDAIPITIGSGPNGSHDTQSGKFGKPERYSSQEMLGAHPRKGFKMRASDDDVRQSIGRVNSGGMIPFGAVVTNQTTNGGSPGTRSDSWSSTQPARGGARRKRTSSGRAAVGEARQEWWEDANSDEEEALEDVNSSSARGFPFPAARIASGDSTTFSDTRHLLASQTSNGDLRQATNTMWGYSTSPPLDSSSPLPSSPEPLISSPPLSSDGNRRWTGIGLGSIGNIVNNTGAGGVVGRSDTRYMRVVPEEEDMTSAGVRGQEHDGDLSYRGRLGLSDEYIDNGDNGKSHRM